MAAERCVLCGASVSAGSQMCRACMDKYSPAAVLETEQELRDIAQVLKITVDSARTDRNIKESMEAILRIADRLGRNRNGR